MSWQEMRIAFCCGVVAFASQDLMSLGDLWAGTGVLFPYIPLLAIPAIQMRSWKLVLRACLLGPLLVLAQTAAGLFFAIDGRELASMAILIPGGWNSTVPGMPVEVLMIHLAIFVLLSGGFLRVFYRDTRLLHLRYFARLLGGGFVLEAVLAFEIEYTTYGANGAINITDAAARGQWALAATTWLIACGLFSAFVFGVKPSEPMVKPI